LYWTSIYLGGKEGQIIVLDKVVLDQYLLGGKEGQIIEVDKVVLDQYLLGGKEGQITVRQKRLV
jgi:hypothetical protein